MSAKALQECMIRNISVGLFSLSGFYIGKISSSDKSGRPELIKAQIGRNSDKRFCMNWAKNVIEAKLHNKKTVLRRHMKQNEADVKSALPYLTTLEKRIERAEDINTLMGIEGTAARVYFSTIGGMLESDFSFEGRTRRPAMDPFNSLINYGYAVLCNQIDGKLSLRGFHPGIGFIHSTYNNRKALAYDLMEEWRPVIVDTLAIHCLNSHEITLKHFQKSGNGGVVLTNEGMKIYRRKIEERYELSAAYVCNGANMDFRKAISYQVDQMAKSVVRNDVDIYKPCRIR